MTSRAWGLNTKGQLGVGDILTHRTPTVLISPPDFIASGAGAGNLALIVSQSRTVYHTGDNSLGQKGDGTTDASNHSTPELVPGLAGIIQVGIDAGFGNCYALDSSDSLWAWGDNHFGQYGRGNTTQQLTPTIIATNVSDFGAGDGHLIVLHSDGSVQTAGYNAAGQLANGFDGGGSSSGAPPGEYHTWQTVTPASGTVVQVAAGYQCVLARRADGSVLGAGFNGGGGQLGNSVGIGSRNNTFFTISAYAGAADILCGYQNTFALLAGGWAGMGNNTSGNLGCNSSTGSFNTPQNLNVPGGIAVAQMIRGWNSETLGFLATDGTIYTWGRGDFGGMGNGGVTASNISPISVNGLTGQRWIGGGSAAVWAGDAVALVFGHPWVAVIG